MIDFIASVFDCRHLTSAPVVKHIPVRALNHKTAKKRAEFIADEAKLTRKRGFHIMVLEAKHSPPTPGCWS